MTESDKVLESLGTRWPSEIVARKEIGKFTGGILSARTLANMDSRGDGIPERFLLANQVAYPVSAVIAWLKERSAESWKSRKKSAES